MEIDVIKSTVSDNYFYLLDDGAGSLALIDPVDGERAVEVVEAKEGRLEAIINTHFHPDHVAGNPVVKRAYPSARLIGPRRERGEIEGQFPNGPGLDELVEGGDRVEVGRMNLEVLLTPGHTSGHISLRSDEALFSGDVIFVAGAGNCRFGGDPGVLYRTFRDILRNLPETTVFYPGHDYAVRNAEFVLSIQPEHPEAEQMLKDATQARAEGRLVLSSLGRERRYNPFLRFDELELQKALETGYRAAWKEALQASDDRSEATFRCVRRLRNEW